MCFTPKAWSHFLSAGPAVVTHLTNASFSLDVLFVYHSRWNVLEKQKFFFSGENALLEFPTIWHQHLSGARFKILFVGLCTVEISGVAFKTLLLLPATQSKIWKISLALLRQHLNWSEPLLHILLGWQGRLSKWCYMWCFKTVLSVLVEDENFPWLDQITVCFEFPCYKDQRRESGKWSLCSFIRVQDYGMRWCHQTCYTEAERPCWR